MEPAVEAPADPNDDSPEVKPGTPSITPAMPPGTRLHSTSVGQSAGATRLSRAKYGAWTLGKPAGCIMLFNPECFLYADLYKLGGNGNANIFHRLDYTDSRANHPNVKDLLVEYRLQPVVTTGRKMAKNVFPISPTFDGALELHELVQNKDVFACYYTWKKLGDGSLGTYIPHIVQLDDEKQKLWDAVKWPSAAEIIATVPIIKFDELIELDERFGAAIVDMD